MNSLAIDDVLLAHTPQLMSIPGVVGTAQGEQDDGTPCILVLVEVRTAALDAAVPDTLDGYPVEVFESGAFEAL